MWPEPRGFSSWISLDKEKLRKMGITTSALSSNRKPTGKGGRPRKPGEKDPAGRKLPEESARCEASPGSLSPARKSGRGDKKKQS